MIGLLYKRRLLAQTDPSERWTGATGEPAVLALHGFGSSPREVDPVLDVAERLGLRGFAPLLPGHGTHVRELAETGWADWCTRAHEALDQLGDAPVIAVGFSLGSLLAAHLAVSRPRRIRALGMLSNATWLTPFTSWFVRGVRSLGVPDFAVPKLGPDIADPSELDRHFTYLSSPVHAASEVLRGGEIVRREIDRIRCPALILHGAHDRVCPVDNAQWVADHIGSSERRVVILPRSRHIITRDYDRETVRQELESFLLRHAAAAPAPHADQTPVEP